MRQVPDYPLWLGHVGDARDLKSVLAAGILALVDLAINESPVDVTHELVYCRFPLLDGGENPPWLLSTAIQTVASLLQASTPTLIFCSAGMSRSPIIAAAAITQVRGISLHEALLVVTRDRPADISPALLADVQAILGQAGSQ